MNREIIVPQAPPATGLQADESAIRSLLESVARAVRTRDVALFLSHCKRDVVVFDMLAPLDHEGLESMRRNWAATLSAFTLPIEYETRELSISIGGDVAFARSLNCFGGTVAGEQSSHWMRTTWCFERIGGVWKIAHQHVSVPFDMSTGRAQLELKP